MEYERRWKAERVQMDFYRVDFVVVFSRKKLERLLFVFVNMFLMGGRL